MRDLLAQELADAKPNLAVDVNAIALQFRAAFTIYRRIRKEFYGRKRSLDRLHETACLIAALEQKGVRNGAH